MRERSALLSRIFYRTFFPPTPVSRLLQSQKFQSSSFLGGGESQNIRAESWPGTPGLPPARPPRPRTEAAAAPRAPSAPPRKSRTPGAPALGLLNRSVRARGLSLRPQASGLRLSLRPQALGPRAWGLLPLSPEDPRSSWIGRVFSSKQGS